jgi:DNA-binding response OmpR family regulator
MLIEDDQPILDMMEILLKRIGYEPILVPEVLDAFRQIKQEPPSLILLDIMMTPINGWEFLEKLRGECNLKEIPVLLFTASPSIEEKIAELKDPRLGVLQKPVSIIDLKAGIEKFLGK